MSPSLTSGLSNLVKGFQCIEYSPLGPKSSSRRTGVYDTRNDLWCHQRSFGESPTGCTKKQNVCMTGIKSKMWNLCVKREVLATGETTGPKKLAPHSNSGRKKGSSRRIVGLSGDRRDHGSAFYSYIKEKKRKRGRYGGKSYINKGDRKRLK